VLLRSLRTMCSPNPIYGHGLRANVTTWLMERLCSPERLRDPRLQVQIENGYFDSATPFYATEYTMDHLLLPPGARERIQLRYYDSGHMIYLHDEDRVKLKGNIAAFIDGAVKR